MVRCFVSDKASALLKLAKDSLMVDRIPDLFHMMKDVSSVMKFSFHRQITSTKKSVVSVQKDINKGLNVAINESLLTALRTKIVNLTIGRGIYQRNLRRLSILLHPFSILSSNPQSSAVVETKMQESLSKIETIKTDFEIPDAQKKLDRVERQIPDAAKQIDLWWNWVNTSLESVDITPELRDWLLLYLLPFIYWSSQLKKTRLDYSCFYHSNKFGTAQCIIDLKLNIDQERNILFQFQYRTNFVSNFRHQFLPAHRLQRIV